MVKRHREEEIAGVLEFEGVSKESAELGAWMAEHKQRGGGKIRLAQGAKGVRVIFSSAADMARWKARWESMRRSNRSAAA